MKFAERLVASWYTRSLTPLGAALWPASVAFRAAVAFRRMLYRAGILRSVRLPVPVVVVGNITVGGTGKTPLVAALASALARRGRRPGIVSRGYGRSSVDGEPLRVTAADNPRHTGDEPLLLARAGYPVVVARDRVAAARALLDWQRHCDVILADDGLQHYRLARSVEIAVVDASRAFGNRSMLPAGPLREPISRLRSVDAVVVLVGQGQPTPAELPHAHAMSFAGEIFVRVNDPHATARAPAFVGDDVHAVAGIGDPGRFFSQLAAMGISAIPHPFPDHHSFVPADLAIDGARVILMTEKDALKCESFADDRCWSLPVRASIDDALITLIEAKLNG